MKTKFLKKLLLLSLIPFMLSISTLGSADQKEESSKKMLNDFSGHWKNQRGSTLLEWQ